MQEKLLDTEKPVWQLICDTFVESLAPIVGRGYGRILIKLHEGYDQETGPFVKICYNGFKDSSKVVANTVEKINLSGILPSKWGFNLVLQRADYIGNVLLKKYDKDSVLPEVQKCPAANIELIPKSSTDI